VRIGKEPPMDWVIAALSYLVVLAAVVLAVTRGRPGELLGRPGGSATAGYEPPGSFEKLSAVLYPIVLALIAAIVWAVLWFGLYAID
jgi:hypothetical protein